MSNRKKESNKIKVLVIGLDGATLDLIRPWVEKGDLPTFNKIMENGVSGNLTSSIPPLSGVAWVSFMTGKNPGNHGIFDFMYRRGNTYEISYISGALQRKKSKNIWQILSYEGKKVGVINVMVTYPPEKVNGFIITGGLTPQGKHFTYPSSLSEELKKKIGKYVILPIGGRAIARVGPDTFLRNTYEMEETKIKAALYLMENYEWDFFMTVFGGIDIIQHEMWAYMDSKHPKHNPKDGIEFGDAILRYYKKMDNAIGEILETVDEYTTVIIMSDHGFGPLYKQIFINTWLTKIGLLQFKNNIFTKFKLWMFKHSFTMKNVYDTIASKSGLIKLLNLFPWFGGGKGEHILNKVFLSQSDVDWNKTKAYSQGVMGQIFINLKEREPNGIVELGKEYEDLKNYIRDKLYEIEDSETGKKVIANVYKKEEIYHGKYFDEAPDIILLPNSGYVPNERFQFISNSVIKPAIASGWHNVNGLVMMTGKDIKKGKKIENGNIIDLAPTILYVMGLPIPSDMDGKVLIEAFQKSYLQNNPIKYRDLKTGKIYTDQLKRKRHYQGGLKKLRFS